MSFKEWAFEKTEISPRKMTGEELLELIDTCLGTMREIKTKEIRNKDEGLITRLLPSSFTIIEFSQRPDGTFS